jgi:hypothetical protein
LYAIRGSKGLPTSTKKRFAALFFASSFTTPWEASKALVDCNKDGDTGSNPIVEADELKKILRLSCYGDEDRELEPRRGVIWALMVSRMGQGDLPSRATTPSIGHLELSGSLGEVRPELANPYLPS